MTETLKFEVDTWISDDRLPSEECATLCALRIVLGQRVLTKVEDSLSKSVRDFVWLSGYSLSVWFATNWWRLRWETSRKGPRTTDWRMTHELAAAGQGYIWPGLTFDSDGERVDVTSVRTEPTLTEPIGYIEDHRSAIDATAYEYAIDNLVELVLGRLDIMHLADTHLHRIWREVCTERRDPDSTDFRQLEARLGYDPDEAPIGLVEELRALEDYVGRGSVAEIASACGGANPSETLRSIVDLADSTGIIADFHVPNSGSGIQNNGEPTLATSVDRGRSLARSARAMWSIGEGPLPDAQLAQIVGVSTSTFAAVSNRVERFPLGLGVRQPDGHTIKLLFQRSHHYGRRNEATRLIADHLVTPAHDHWLPSTASRTARQKLQSAFAAEFLCPVNELLDHLEGDFSDEAINEAGDYYMVSPLTVRTHLVGVGITPRFGTLAEN